MTDAGADAGISADSFSLEGVFRDMALAMYSMVSGEGSPGDSELVNVTLQSHSLEGLLVAWLNELIYMLDTSGFVAGRVEITSLETEPPGLTAVLAGERFEGDRLGQGLLIKAATYHGLKIAKEDGKWSAEIMLDI